jgi:pimeloyl-ACP methyl ester carboxylesterase
MTFDSIGRRRCAHAHASLAPHEIRPVWRRAGKQRRSRSGLAGFRLAPDHAEDLGKAIADVRARIQGPVWVIGSSRGSISAVNAAMRLTGRLRQTESCSLSALMVGSDSRARPWLYQTVFEARLEDIKVPVLVVGHAADKCLRSPARLMDKITARTNGAREQVVTVTGGPDYDDAVSIEACVGIHRTATPISKPTSRPASRGSSGAAHTEGGWRKVEAGCRGRDLTEL